MNGNVTWQVVGNGIHQDTDLAPGGTGIETVWVVPYRITSGPAAGSTGQVKIPPALFTPDAVRAAIESQVNAHHAVAGLES